MKFAEKGNGRPIGSHRNGARGAIGEGARVWGAGRLREGGGRAAKRRAEHGGLGEGKEESRDSLETGAGPWVRARRARRRGLGFGKTGGLN
jgi:hypothetical protein